MKNALPGLKQFRSEGCLSYLLFDRATREAIMIDPQVDLMEDYREFIAENGLKPGYALDTHTHADHYSGTHLFKQAYGSEIVLSALAESARTGKRVRSGDSLAVGSLKLSILETPGHTPDSISVYGEGMVFTGDTLFIGASGRTDFPGADAAAQWKSIHEVLGALPGDTLVMPGHDYSELIFSTIDVERKTNPHWLLPNLDTFVAFKRGELMQSPTPPDEVRARIRFNREASPATSEAAGQGCATACGTAAQGLDRGTASIGVEKYVSKLQEKTSGTLYLDVRESGEFADGHMPGVANIPLSELALHWSELKKASRIYVSCLSGRRSGIAARTLSYLGLPDVVNVSGGYQAWRNAGLPVLKK